MASGRDLLPDEVWQQLDPRAGQLTPAARRRARWGARVTVVAAALMLVVWQSGTLLPRARSGDQSYGSMSDSLHHTFEVRVDVRNAGWTDMRVEGIGRDGSGLRLLSVDTKFPVALPSSSGRIVTLTYTVTDCALVPQGDWPIPVRISRPWGQTTSWFHLRPAVPMNGAPTGMRQFSGRDPYALEWQAAIATDACAPYDPTTAETPPAG